jgi:phosphoribosylanthranilate isomerase
VTPRVKICCITSVAEAELAIRAGASALGLVSAMPSGPGVLEEEAIRTIAARIPPGVTSVLLTSKRSAGEIVGQQRRCRVGAIQLCDRLELDGHRHLRQALPGVALIQVVHVEGPDAVEEARLVAAEVDALLLDSGRPGLPVRELGGTGRTHDWALSRAIVESVPVPVFLAGGLDPENVGEAVRRVSPYGLDVCSGLRGPEGLDPRRLGAFMARVGDRSLERA